MSEAADFGMWLTTRPASFAVGSAFAVYPMLDAIKEWEALQHDKAAQVHVEHHVASDDGMPEPSIGIAPSGQLEADRRALRAQADSVRVALGGRPFSTQELWNAATQDPLDLIALEAAAELRRGDSMWGHGIQWPTNSVSHEAYAVLLEEVDELWDEVKAKRIDRAKARKEAIHVAAMALRFVRNVCDTNPDVSRAEWDRLAGGQPE